MGFNYENQGSVSYLVYTLENSDVIDTMGLGMITNNHIQGFAPAIFTQTDEVRYIKYNVSAKVSVRQLFAGVINKKRLLGVFSGIADALLSAGDYMIDPDSILLDPDYMFADVSTCDTVMICLPLANSGQKSADPGSFLKAVMFSSKFDQTENCDYVTRLINFLNGTASFSAMEFKKILLELAGGVASRPQRVTPVEIPVRPAGPTAGSQIPAKPAGQPAIPKPVQKPAAAPVQERPGISKAPAPPFSVPQADGTQNRSAAPAAGGNGGDEISFFYLLQHYNKDNASRYKEQKAAKKQAGEARERALQEAKGKKKKEKQQKRGQADVPGFLAPGMAEPSSAASPEPVPPRPAAQVPEPQPAAAAVIVASEPAPKTGAGFGETTVLGTDMLGETTVLSRAASENNLPYLIRRKTNERVCINKPVFRIGKERSYVDYFIGDNSAISRSHANIVNRDGQYYIVDTNSTNHTFVNGGMIGSNTETCLSHGSVIRLADEEFTFNMY